MKYVLVVIMLGQSYTAEKIDTYKDEASCKEAGGKFAADLREKLWATTYFSCVPAAN